VLIKKGAVPAPKFLTLQNYYVWIIPEIELKIQKNPK